MKSKVSEHGLDGVEIFHDLEESERARLAAELETLNLKRGDVLVRQGETAVRAGCGPIGQECLAWAAGGVLRSSRSGEVTA